MTNIPKVQNLQLDIENRAVNFDALPGVSEYGICISDGSGYNFWPLQTLKATTDQGKLVFPIDSLSKNGSKQDFQPGTIQVRVMAKIGNDSGEFSIVDVKIDKETAAYLQGIGPKPATKPASPPTGQAQPNKAEQLMAAVEVCLETFKAKFVSQLPAIEQAAELVQNQQQTNDNLVKLLHAHEKNFGGVLKQHSEKIDEHSQQLSAHTKQIDELQKAQSSGGSVDYAAFTKMLQGLTASMNTAGTAKPPTPGTPPGSGTAAPAPTPAPTPSPSPAPTSAGTGGTGTAPAPTTPPVANPPSGGPATGAGSQQVGSPSQRWIPGWLKIPGWLTRPTGFITAIIVLFLLLLVGIHFWPRVKNAVVAFLTPIQAGPTGTNPAGTTDRNPDPSPEMRAAAIAQTERERAVQNSIQSIATSQSMMLQVFAQNLAALPKMEQHLEGISTNQGIHVNGSHNLVAMPGSSVQNVNMEREPAEDEVIKNVIVSEAYGSNTQWQQPVNWAMQHQPARFAADCQPVVHLAYSPSPMGNAYRYPAVRSRSTGWY